MDSQRVRNELLGMASNYSLGQQELSLEAQRFNAEIEQNAKQFAENMNLEWAKLNSDERQFYMELAQNQKQFEDKLKQDAEQFEPLHIF